jgi:hypothetical protein
MDLAQILDLVKQHGNAVYALVFGYAAAHSLLLVLFAGYAAQWRRSTGLRSCWCAGPAASSATPYGS